MEIYIITALNYKSGDVKLPKKGTLLEVSENGEKWCKAYFVELNGDKNPFVCVNKLGDVNFPYTKGTRWSIMRVINYEISDVVLMNNFRTIDGFYETYKEKPSNNSYWQRTKLGETNGVTNIWNHKLCDNVFAEADGIEKAVEILNKLK